LDKLPESEISDFGQRPALSLPKGRETLDSGWTLADQWIRARMAETIADVNRLFENFQYLEAGRQVYDFFWS
ncbi:MAG: class I tRNA ligase family protein, partial [Chloroflexota bacterium]